MSSTIQQRKKGGTSSKVVNEISSTPSSSTHPSFTQPSSTQPSSTQPSSISISFTTTVIILAVTVFLTTILTSLVIHTYYPPSQRPSQGISQSILIKKSLSHIDQLKLLENTVESLEHHVFNQEQDLKKFRELIPSPSRPSTTSNPPPTLSGDVTLYLHTYATKDIHPIILPQGTTDMPSLIQLISTTVGRSLHWQLFNGYGQRLNTLSQIHPNDDIYALEPNELYFFDPYFVSKQGGKIEIPIEEDGKTRTVTLHLISTKPRVFRITGFLDDAEIHHIITHAKPKLIPSRVGGQIEGSTVNNLIRNSWQAWFDPGQNNEDDVFRRVRNRGVHFMNVRHDIAEDFQIIYYKPNEHYSFHYDWSSPDVNSYFRGGGNRFATLLFYFNNVTEGGATSFPSIGRSKAVLPHERPHGPCFEEDFKVYPAYGEVTLFYNLTPETHRDGVGDDWAIHAGCDVIQGEKWAGNLWLRNKRVDGRLYDDHW